MLLSSILIGALFGAVVDYWLGRFSVKEPVRIVAAAAVGVLVAILGYASGIRYF